MLKFRTSKFKFYKQLKIVYCPGFLKLFDASSRTRTQSFPLPFDGGVNF